MKSLVVFLTLLGCSAGMAAKSSFATTYSDIDDRTTGWGSCTGLACAGGANANSYWMSENQNPPSVDGTSTEFFVDGPAWTNVLFWNKVGPNDAAVNFKTDYWVQFDQNSKIIGQAFEFDTFQFVNGREYMFGTQCDYGAGVWDVWDAAVGTWRHTSVACPKFTPNVWYHITWYFHRSNVLNDNRMYYDGFKMVQYDAKNKAVASNSYLLKLAYGSATLPPGWSNNLGVQFQMDLNGQAGVNNNPSTMTEYVDRVTLTAW